MEAGWALQVLQESHQRLLAIYKVRPTDRNWANVLGAERVYQDYQIRMATERASDRGQEDG